MTLALVVVVGDLAATQKPVQLVEGRVLTIGRTPEVALLFGRFQLRVDSATLRSGMER